ncbi:MAG: hypothetical protein L0Z73_07870 [Gammaproteobacteria bacterium]|nr:hypothetical protein [Gammaproteobacteria bacterium]
MIRKHLLTITLGCAVAMTITTNIAYADTAGNGYKRPSRITAQLPAYYPSHFPSLGVLTEMRASHDWVINGKAIKVSSNVIVHSLVTNFSSLYSVKQGMELAYRVNKDGEVAEVWALPNGAIDRN